MRRITSGKNKPAPKNKRGHFFFTKFPTVVNRKLIVPQKEPSPLLDRKIEELEAKFADMTDEELEDLGDDDGDLGEQSLSLMQSSMSGDMDMMSYTPPQVGPCAGELSGVFSCG